MSKFSQYLGDPPAIDGKSTIDPIVNHDHQDLVQAVAFNSYGDRCATGSVDGKIRVFNRHKDGKWRVCDSWSAHGGEILEVWHHFPTSLHTQTSCLTYPIAPMAPPNHLPQPPRLPRYRRALQALGRKPLRRSPSSLRRQRHPRRALCRSRRQHPLLPSCRRLRPFISYLRRQQTHARL